MIEVLSKLQIKTKSTNKPLYRVSQKTETVALDYTSKNLLAGLHATENQFHLYRLGLSHSKFLRTWLTLQMNFYSISPLIRKPKLKIVNFPLSIDFLCSFFSIFPRIIFQHELSFPVKISNWIANNPKNLRKAT